MGVLSRTGVRNDVRNSEYFEKPHVMRNRQKSERHRRRFQEMVSVRLGGGSVRGVGILC
jgi:ribosomal protein S21